MASIDLCKKLATIVSIFKKGCRSCQSSTKMLHETIVISLFRPSSGTHTSGGLWHCCWQIMLTVTVVHLLALHSSPKDFQAKESLSAVCGIQCVSSQSFIINNYLLLYFIYYIYLLFI